MAATRQELRTVLSVSGEEKYTASMKSIRAALSGVSLEQKLLNSQYEKGDKSLSKLSRQQELLQRKLDAQKKKVELINKAYQESVKQGDKAAKTTEQLARDLTDAQAAVNNTERALNKLSKEMEHANSRTAQFREAMKALKIDSKDVGGALQTAGDRVSKLSLAFATTVTATSVKGWMTLEDEMANVATIADTSEKSIGELTDEIIAASNATGVAANEMAQAQYQAISANVATAESAGLVENAAKAAKAGVSDVTTVIDGATSIMNGWGIAVEDSEAVFDKLLKTQERGKTTIGELASSIGQVTGLAPQLNVSLEETLAAVGALTQNGVQTSTAMNGLKAVFSAILKPTAEAREEAERLGLQFDTAALKTQGLTGFLEEIVEKTGGSEESLAKLFGSVEGLSQIMLLGGNAAGMYADILDDLGNSAGTLETMFGVRTSSSAQRFSMALNQINNAAISLGQSLAPMIEVAAEKIEDFADAISNMSAEEAQSVISTALWIAGISKGISVLGGLIKHASTAAKAIKAIGTLLTPGGAVIGGIALAGAAIAGLAAAARKVSTEVQLDLSVDPSDVENYRIDTQTLEDPVTMVAAAKLEIDRKLSDFGTGVTDWLSDGKRETQEELDTFVEELNGIIGNAYSSISRYQQEKKAELDAQLAAGLITPESYDTALATLESQASDLETELTTASTAVVDYVASLVASNKTITKEEIGQLNALLETLNLTAASVLDATNTAKQAYEWAYQKTAAGVSDEADLQKAVEYVELQYSTDEASLETAGNAVRAKYAGMAVGKTEAEIAALAEQEAAELAQIQTQLDQLGEERAAMYAELLAGEAKKLGIAPEDLELYLKNYGTTVEDIDKYREFLGKTYIEAGQAEKIAELDKLREILVAVGDADLSGLEKINAFYTTNTGGDASNIEDTNEALQELLDMIGDTEELDGLPDEYGEIGSNAADSLATSVRRKLPEAYAAGAAIGTALTKGVKSTLKIASPSKVFDEIGRYSMEGLIGGVNSQLERVQAAYKAAVTPKTTTTSEAKASASAATTVINNHINYTAGAGTRREARMLNQRLAQEQKASLIAEGL